MFKKNDSERRRPVSVCIYVYYNTGNITFSHLFDYKILVVDFDKFKWDIVYNFQEFLPSNKFFIVIIEKKKSKKTKKI